MISQSIESALENGEISVWLQPQFNFVTNKIIGAEALCRWTHNSLGWISPGEFIPIWKEQDKSHSLITIFGSRLANL